jgi:hypothetical protein
MIPVYDHDNLVMIPSDVSFRDVVSVSMRYDGCYAKPGMGFGHMWCLLAVKDFGPIQNYPTMMNRAFAPQLEDGEVLGEDSYPTKNPMYLFPEIDEVNDLPRSF